MHQQHMQQAAHAHAAGASGAPPYYPTPAFQNHMEQLGKLTPFSLSLSIDRTLAS